MTAPPRNFILATAGHVDHGKSTLVRALTGLDPDRLVEEKRRGISIELSFASLRLRGDYGQTFQIGIVDVPGHEDFIKTMIGGIAAADAALLVIAADDGVKPQTLEHIQILSHLGIRIGLIALTKIDRVESIDQPIQLIRVQLHQTMFANSRIVPLSNVTGAGLGELQKAIVEMLSELPATQDIGKPRLWVDRAFTGSGVGTIVTGTLTGGTFAAGQDIILRPGDRRSRIRSLHSHGEVIQNARAGSRVALNLPDVQIDQSGARGVARGQFVTLDSVGVDSDLFDASLLCDSANPPRDGAALSIHLGTARTTCRLYYFDPPDARLIRVRLNGPLPLMIGDRFILRSASGRATLGGGVVLDPSPTVRRSWRKNVAQFELLKCRLVDPLDPDLAIQSQLAQRHFCNASDLFRMIRASNDDCRAAAERLNQAGRLFVIGSLLVAADFWEVVLAEIVAAIETFHREQPNRPGLPLTKLRAMLGVYFSKSAAVIVWPKLIESLAARKFDQSGDVVRLRSFRPALPPRLAGVGEQLRNKLIDGGLNIVARSQLAPTDAAAEALRFLIANGEAIELSRELAVSAAAYASAAKIVREQIRQQGPLTVTQIKSLLSSSRRITVPLLERFDREGITRREVDLRTLGPAE